MFSFCNICVCVRYFICINIFIYVSIISSSGTGTHAVDSYTDLVKKLCDEFVTMVTEMKLLTHTAEILASPRFVPHRLCWQLACSVARTR